MCGIIGTLGGENAVPFLLDGLRKLEYRGYDSAGIAVADKNGISVAKRHGNVDALDGYLSETLMPAGSTVGIGHTRWATHGAPTDENAHPHLSRSGDFAIVHNGIIENYQALRAELEQDGFAFESDTDSEVIPQLLESRYDGDFLDCMLEATAMLEGSYAIAALCAENPDTIICACKSSPLLVAKDSAGCRLASDLTAIGHAGEVYRMEDGELAVLSLAGITFFNSAGSEIHKPPLDVNISETVADKGGYKHFMLKEIMEQPSAIAKTLESLYDSGGNFAFRDELLSPGIVRKYERLHIVACGSAYHVGVNAKYIFEEFARIPCSVDVASEFRYRCPVFGDNDIVIVISQSGETADTLAALREARENGVPVISVVNVPQSAIARESDAVILTCAGREIAVATTKAYSAQLAVMYSLALYFAYTRAEIQENEYRRMVLELRQLPSKTEAALRLSDSIRAIAQSVKDSSHVYFIGRNTDYAAALEASLKLKEISYINAEAYPAGELKHGTISLIEEGSLVIALACCERLSAKTAANVKEVKARGAKVICVAAEGLEEAVDADVLITVPNAEAMLMPSVEIVAMQLLSYYIADLRGCDIDKPKNLAKSVTVE